MSRWFTKSWVGFGVVVALAAIASAEPNTSSTYDVKAQIEGQGPRPAVIVQPSSNPHSVISPFLYLNRCKGGCMITGTGGGATDARTQTSGIPGPGSYMLGEFANAYGQLSGGMGTCTGDNSTICANDGGCITAGGTCNTADVEWANVVACMKEVYSPFAVTVTDMVPTGGVSYTEALIAGQPSDIGLPAEILGIAPLTNDCSPQDNVISFSFANHHAAQDRVFNICWTAAQESAHAFGLDHEYQFADNSSACNDPMTYRTDCGGEKFFRNKPASCGENAVRTCRCGGSQNSHSKLINVFGAGMSTVPAPTVSVLTPAAGPVTNGFTVHATAGSRRGVEHVDLYLNGYKWSSAAGAMFGQEGQQDPSQYTLTTPNSVPDGVIDIVVKAYDDLGIETDAPTVTVTKGAPCTTAASCATGQKCDAGKCFWDPPAGMLGDKCTYPQFCTSGICQGTADLQICTQACLVGVDGSCPANYDCVQTTGTSGICFPSSGGGGGCCSVGHDSGNAIWIHFGLGAAVLGLMIRRRRR